MSTDTAVWFAQNPSISSHVAALLKRQFPREDFESLLSEVNLWVAIWGKNGTCDAYIKNGKPPSASILKVWVSQKLSHRMYRDGKDALRRECMGSRTQMEVRKRKEDPSFVHPQTLMADSNAPEVVHVGRGEDFEVEFVNPEVNVDCLLERQDQINFVQDVIRVKRSRAADRYARFCDHLLKGRSKEETAMLEGVSQLRVTHMYQKVRNDLKDAPLLIAIAYKMLEALVEEPWSTADELEDKGDETKHALNFLVIRGLVRQGSGESFAPTNAGMRAVKAGSLI